MLNRASFLALKNQTATINPLWITRLAATIPSGGPRVDRDSEN
jgi:hypothetical protein